MPDSSIAKRLASLSTLSLRALDNLWRQLFKKEPPEIRKDLMLRIIAHRLQEQAFGGLGDAGCRRLRQLAATFEADPDAVVSNRPPIKAGTRLVRQWKEQVHVVEVLLDHHIAPSMSRPGNPYDNAKCESFMKTLKQEEIHTREYRDRADLEAHIGHFLEQYYNRQRLHSALNYRSPEQFERSLLETSRTWRAARMSFLRHEEIYRPDGVEQVREEP